MISCAKPDKRAASAFGRNRHFMPLLSRMGRAMRPLSPAPRSRRVADRWPACRRLRCRYKQGRARARPAAQNGPFCTFLQLSCSMDQNKLEKQPEMVHPARMDPPSCSMDQIEVGGAPPRCQSQARRLGGPCQWGLSAAPRRPISAGPEHGTQAAHASGARARRPSGPLRAAARPVTTKNGGEAAGG